MFGKMPGNLFLFVVVSAAVLANLLMAFDYVRAQTIEKKEVKLLASSGQFPVGHILLDWTDSSRYEPATAEADDKRQVVVEIWYPATSNAKGKRSPYRTRLEIYRKVIDERIFKLISSVQTPWIEESAVNNKSPFGVLLFSHGWNSQSSSYGTFLSNVASHGYIVVGINHPFMGTIALSDGALAAADDSRFPTQHYADEFYADDVIFVIDQLAKLNESDKRFKAAMDMNKIAAGGHSSGFPAVSGAAVRDRRIKSLISFDAGVPTSVRREGLDVPLLLFRGETNSYTDLFFRGEKVHPKGTIYDVDFFRIHRADFYDLVISGTTHNSVFDEYLFVEAEKERELSKRNHKIIERFVVAFLEKVLSGIENPILSGSNPVENTKLRIVKAFRLQNGRQQIKNEN